MNRASVEQALTGLIPTHNGPLSPELVDLALSLLTRSRSVAHSLKPDEEIARPYACAQLACERLKTRLNLPSIASRPPCPPRVYKKLYDYLSSALPAATTTREPQTPRKNNTSAPASARTTPKTPLSAKKTPRTARKDDNQAGQAPEWVMPGIRTLLKQFAYPNAAPHVFTGVESILPLLARMSAAAAETPSKRPRRSANPSQPLMENVTETRALGLVGVLCMYVLARMMDQPVTPEEYTQRREIAVKTLLELPVAAQITYKDLSDETEQLMFMAQEEGWLQMEWFLNITPPCDGEEMEGVEATSAGPIRNNNGIRGGGSDYIGLGTMLQDATDYLGERQQSEYENWKAKIMARVEEIEAA